MIGGCLMSVDVEHAVAFVRAHGAECDRAWVRVSKVCGRQVPPVAGCTLVYEDGMLPQKQVYCLRNTCARVGGPDGEVLGSGDVPARDSR